jgi:hypothetical protein
MKELISCFAFLAEDNAWVFSCGRLDLVDRKFFEQFLPACGLSRFGGVGTEAFNKLLKLFALVFYFAVLV